MLIDFKEIPPAKCGKEQSATKDEFELFAREFLTAIGFMIVDGPDRGPDSGRDLVVEEQRNGIGGSTTIKWLVSCKHKAHTGNSVVDDDEKNISDRLRLFECNGFLAFYSTTLSSGLRSRLNGIKNSGNELLIYDNEYIERLLLGNEKCYALIPRFFPNSAKKIKESKFAEPNILSKYEPLKCEVCGRDLIQKDIVDGYNGNLVMVEDFETNQITDVVCVCKGVCDHRFTEICREQNKITMWEDISDITIPYQYLCTSMSFINHLHTGQVQYSDKAFEKTKKILIILSQRVFRQQTKEEIERIKALKEIPKGI